ncbi:MAG: toll/interleukin-1 receptor domain-containing protein [Bryobacteraceae bacterium]
MRMFYSYSHRDERMREKLEKHLSALKHSGIIAEWHDRKILPGDNFDHAISDHLEAADLILFLVSADFLASDYIRDVEVKRALELNNEGKARVIPIILRPVDLGGLPFESLLRLPKDGLPVTKWKSQDAAFEDIARGIRAAVGRMKPDATSAKDRATDGLTALAQYGAKLHYDYRAAASTLISSPELARRLAARYGCEPLQLGKVPIASTIIWQNTRDVIQPDRILGGLDHAEPSRENRIAGLLTPSEYDWAMRFIRSQDGFVYDGTHYCLGRIELRNAEAKISGRYCKYSDHLLNESLLEWELRKALSDGGDKAIDKLAEPGTLPLREAIESVCNPLLDGGGRCAAIGVSTLVIFKRRDGNFYCILKRRSTGVATSRGWFHVIPAGMFEAEDRSLPWSIEMNVWRELLEEVYDEKEQQGTGESVIEDHIIEKVPISLLRRLIHDGSAELSVTGVCCDLLWLRPEVCTILYVEDPQFITARQMRMNWEFDNAPSNEVAGNGLMRWQDVDGFIDKAARNIVRPGAACVALAKEWIRQRHPELASGPLTAV